MKKSELSFIGGLTSGRSVNNNHFKIFDWDKAAKFINEKRILHPDLSAEAGLKDDWGSTGGVIFEKGQPVTEDRTYLKSDWATPTLILSWNDEEQEEIPCYTQDESTRFGSDSKWDEESLTILNSISIY